MFRVILREHVATDGGVKEREGVVMPGGHEVVERVTCWADLGERSLSSCFLSRGRMQSKLDTFDGLRLITLCNSHYCESARWALQACGVKYREEGFFVGGGLSKNPAVNYLRTFDEEFVPAKYVDKVGGGAVGHFEELGDAAIAANVVNNTPCALTHDGRVLHSSFEIVEYAIEASGGKFVCWVGDEQFLKKLDVFGQAARHLWMALINCKFSEDLPPESAKAVATGFLFCAGSLEFHTTFDHEKFSAVTYKKWRFGEPGYGANSPKALKIIDDTFEMISSMITKSGGPYIGGQTPSADDFQFCGLASFIVYPPQYGPDNPTFPHRPGLKDLSQTYQAMIGNYRATATGKYILEMYKQYRFAGKQGELILQPSHLYVDGTWV